MLVDTFHYTILCRDFPYFLFEKKESMQRKTLTLRATGWWQDKGRNEGLALRAIAFGRNGSQREGRSLRTFFLRKKESTQRKTLTLRATGRQQDESRNGGGARASRSRSVLFLRKKKVCKEKLSRFAQQVGSKMKSEKREGRSRFAQSLGQDKVGLLVADSRGMGYNGRKKKSPVMAGEGRKE